jgi:peroxiredoxin
MVGGCANPKKSDQALRQFGVDISHYLLDTAIHLIHMNKSSISFLMIAVMLAACNQPKKTEKAITQEINELPYLSYQALTGDTVSTRTLPGSSILVLFNTECDHCQRQAKEISERMDAFKNYQMLFIAADSVHKIDSFSKTYNLANLPNVKFGRAEYQEVFMNFGSIPTPSVYIYSRERKLVKSFLGETPVEELIKYL